MIGSSRSIKFLLSGTALILIGISIFLIKQRLTQKENPPDHQARINEFIYNGLNFPLGKTRAEIISSLGNPENTATAETRNIHYPNRIDKVHKLFYKGLYIRIYEGTETGKEIITDISITSDKYRLKWGISVGCSEDVVIRNFGTPHEVEENAYIYGSDGAPSYIYFYLRDRSVYRIDWEFYID